MANRKPKKSDFEGKTIRAVNIQCDNVWTFYFTDGTSLAIEAESYYPTDIPVLEVCETCVQPEGCNVPKTKKTKRQVPAAHRCTVQR